MRSNLSVWLPLLALLVLAKSSFAAEIQANLVCSMVVWDQAPRNINTDLVRFQDRWWIVCRESSGEFTEDATLRVITSRDGKKWESAASIPSPTPNRNLDLPKFTIAPNGQLMLSALGIVPTPEAPDGGAVRSMAWHSKDGLNWGPTDTLGVDNFPFSRLVWHRDVAYGYANGVICGAVQTVRIYGRSSDQPVKELFEETFSGFLPQDAALLFDGNVGYCVMARVSASGGNAPISGYFGRADAPYRNWKFKDLNLKIRSPNLIRLADKRVIVAAGLMDNTVRTSLCELDLTTGQLTEFLELPTGGRAIDVGLAEHEGQLWVSYHSSHEGKLSVSLAKVKLD